MEKKILDELVANYKEKSYAKAIVSAEKFLMFLRCRLTIENIEKEYEPKEEKK